MSEEVTRFGKLEDLAWQVYRVRTGSSSYTVGVYEYEGRRFAVMRGQSKNLGGHVDLRDSDPKVDGRSLFQVPPSEWVGKSLEIGTATTSRVVEVRQEQDPEVLTNITRIQVLAPSAPAPAARQPQASPEPKYEEPPYPENCVQDVRAAAYLLRRVYNQRRLIEDLEQSPEQFDRFKVALADAALMMKAIGQKLG
ncbi:hypothetical protein [Corallococcus carmarthensis]|nr:hypothetical protein [Corallococcus carmarthensis]